MQDRARSTVTLERRCLYMHSRGEHQASHDRVFVVVCVHVCMGIIILNSFGHGFV